MRHLFPLAIIFNYRDSSLFKTNIVTKSNIHTDMIYYKKNMDTVENDFKFSVINIIQQLNLFN